MNALRTARVVTDLVSWRGLLGSHARFAWNGGENKFEFVSEDKRAQTWKERIDSGDEVNPCGSRNHPAVKHGLMEAAQEQISLQEAYSPWSRCFGCGPSAGADAMRVRSFRAEESVVGEVTTVECCSFGTVEGGPISNCRAEEGVVAEVTIPERFSCFPGTVAGGPIATLLECHGNWAAAVRLMDESCLPRPPLTVTYSLQLSFRDMTPPEKPLKLMAKAVNITKSSRGKLTVEVDLRLCDTALDGSDKVLVTGTGHFRRVGALRSL